MSRISTVPPTCETPDIPKLSVEAARDTFHRIYKNCGQSDLRIDNILKRLDFYPLSITLLATVAHHNKWDTDRLNGEWERRRTDVLCMRHDTSLATTIELSLASPMFQELGPDARELLGVVAFFPQGVCEDNLDWLFSTFPNKTNVFDTPCVLSLTYRAKGFITMLAPLRDHFRPKDLTSSPLLCATRDHYFHRLSVHVNPGEPGFEEARWISTEDANVEHLLDIFTVVDTSSVEAWDEAPVLAQASASHAGVEDRRTPKRPSIQAAVLALVRMVIWLSRELHRMQATPCSQPQPLEGEGGRVPGC